MIEISNRTRSKINIGKVKKVVEIFLNKNNLKKCDISIGFIGDIKMRKLNKNYRNVDKITDILSFSGEGNFLGELIINYAQIKRQARKFSDSALQELVFILVHGLLHLIGYSDDKEVGARKMDRLGKEFIKEMEVRN